MVANRKLVGSEAERRRDCGTGCRSCARDLPPTDLLEMAQWVGWHWEERNGKKTKPPLDPHGYGYASVSNPETWATYAEAKAFANQKDGAGIGFVFCADDPYAGVDLDKCRNPETGAIEPWAQSVIGYLDSYSEVSPSGTGVKVFLRGRLSGGVKRGQIEAYSSERYFTVTGCRLTSAPATVQDRQGRLDLLTSWLRPVRSPRSDSRPTPLIRDDEELIRRAMNAANGAAFGRLWRGDWSGYGSQSEADLALCSHLMYWTDGDEIRSDRLFRQAGLCRAKWDERHYGDGRTYGEVTMAKAATIAKGQARANDRAPQNGSHELDNTGGSTDLLETDMGNAVRLARRHGDDIRYCYTTGVFHVWDGTYWPADRTGQIYRRAKDTARSILEEARAAPSTDRSKQLAQHAVRSQAEQRLVSMVRLVRSEPGLAIVPSDLDGDGWLLNVANGTVDLRNGQLRPHCREDLITKITRVRFDQSATCPRWLEFLDRIMNGNQDVIRFLQKSIGYSMTGEVSEQVVFFLHGTGANGKSTLISVLLELLGDYGRQAAPGLLTLKRGESHPTELADLAGARFVAAVEVDEGRRLAEALTKWLTGGDRLKARFMRQDFFEFPPTHKLWLAANHKPTVTGSDHAIWRRLRLIPFDVAIPDEEQDKLLGNKLRRELPGILNWAIEGCLAWQNEGLEPPNEVVLATKNYRDEQDILAGFLRDCCQLGNEFKATAKELYGAFRKWCEDNGETPFSQKVFGGRLSDRSFTNHRGTKGQRWWAGLGLVTHPGLDSDMGDG